MRYSASAHFTMFALDVNGHVIESGVYTSPLGVMVRFHKNALAVFDPALVARVEHGTTGTITYKDTVMHVTVTPLKGIAAIVHAGSLEDGTITGMVGLAAQGVRGEEHGRLHISALRALKHFVNAERFRHILPPVVRQYDYTATARLAVQSDDGGSAREASA